MYRHGCCGWMGHSIKPVGCVTTGRGTWPTPATKTAVVVGVSESELQRIARELQELADRMPSVVSEIRDHMGWADQRALEAAYEANHREDPNDRQFAHDVAVRFDHVRDSGEDVIAGLEQVRRFGQWWVERSIATGSPAAGRPPQDWTPGQPPAAKSPGVGVEGGRTSGTDTAPDSVSEFVRASLADAHPEVAAVLVGLLADRAHSLDLTRALFDPRTRERTLATIHELVAGGVLADQDLDEYRASHPGRGPLFDTAPSEPNDLRPGESHKAAYLRVCKKQDAARRVGANPTDDEYSAVVEYCSRLRNAVAPRVWSEVSAIAGEVDGIASIRTKNTADVLDKVTRMSSGTSGRSSRAGYEVGDVVDAVGARVTVPDTEALERALVEVRSRFGTGPQSRVLELENMYAAPKPHNRAYRVVPLLISTEADGQPYTFELQLCTRRASIASDLEHNTIYKAYVESTPIQQTVVRRMQAEAAALDQQETRRRYK